MGEACLAHTVNTGLFNAVLATARMEVDLPWYALKTRVGGELMTLNLLRARGFEPYCPVHKERRRYSDRIKIVEAALFPGYVFCQFDIQKKLPIISCPGVEYIVGFSNGPTPVPEKEISDVRRLMAAGASAMRGLARGQRVRVAVGPLEGVEGVLVRDIEGDRLVVSIGVLSQGASLHINQDQVCEIAAAN